MNVLYNRVNLQARQISEKSFISKKTLRKNKALLNSEINSYVQFGFLLIPRN